MNQRLMCIAALAASFILTTHARAADEAVDCTWAFRLTQGCVDSKQGDWRQCAQQLERTMPADKRICFATGRAATRAAQTAGQNEAERPTFVVTASDKATPSQQQCLAAEKLVLACVNDGAGSEAQCQQWQVRRLPELAQCFDEDEKAVGAPNSQPAPPLVAEPPANGQHLPAASNPPDDGAQIAELPPGPEAPRELKRGKGMVKLILPQPPELEAYLNQVAGERDIISENDLDRCDRIGLNPGTPPAQGPYEDPGDVCSTVIAVEDLREQDPRFAQMQKYFTDTRTYMLGCDPVRPPFKAGDPPSVLANLREGQRLVRRGKPVYVFSTTGIPYDTCQFRLLTVAFVGDKTTGHLGAALWHPIPDAYLATEIVEPGKLTPKTGWDFGDGKPAYHFGRTPNVHAAALPPPLPPAGEPPPPPPCNCRPWDYEFWPLDFGAPPGHYGDAAAQ